MDAGGSEVPQRDQDRSIDSSLADPDGRANTANAGGISHGT
jgi:hypothetical protein